MSSQHKKLYLYAGINFLIGTVIGIVLFYGQMRSNPSVFTAGYSYDKTVEIIDFFRAWWLNTMWLFAIFISNSVMRLAPFHIIVAVRGCASSYGIMYLLNCIGIKEAVASVLPQCLTVLPLLMWFSVLNTEKRAVAESEGRDGISLKRIDAVKMFAFSLISALAEMIIFTFLCNCLF